MLLFSIGITFLTILFLEVINATEYINFEIVIIPVLSLLWGPFGVLGFVIVETAYFLVCDPNDYIFTVKVISMLFISNMLLWKLWYSVMNR